MKFNLIIYSFLIGITQLSAQEEQPTPTKTFDHQEQTVFSRSQLHGGWGGVNFSTSKVGNYSGYGTGGSIGLIFNSLSVGLYGNGEVFDGFRRDDKDYAFTLGHGGLMMGYSFPTQRSLHLTSTVKLGAGSVGLARQYNDFDWNFEEEDFNDAILVVVPEIGLELNLTHWMRMSATAGYRFVDGFEGISELSKKDLNAPMFGLNFRFGWFGHCRKG